MKKFLSIALIFVLVLCSNCFPSNATDINNIAETSQDTHKSENGSLSRHNSSDSKLHNDASKVTFSEKAQNEIKNVLLKLEKCMNHIKENECINEKFKSQLLENLSSKQYLTYKIKETGLKFLFHLPLPIAIYAYMNHKIKQIFSDSEIKRNLLNTLNKFKKKIVEYVDLASKENKYYYFLNSLLLEAEKATSTCFNIKVPSDL